MKTALIEALEKLREKEIRVKLGRVMRKEVVISAVELKEAEKILQEFEVALLNEIDQKKLAENKTSY